MQNDILETIEHKGYTIRVYTDDDAPSPDYWKDDGVFLVGTAREFHVERGGITVDTLRAIACGGFYESEEEHPRARELMAAYWIYRLGIRQYSSADNVHLDLMEELSGKTIEEAYNEYDSYYPGAVFIKRDEAPTKEKADGLAAGLLEDWDHYLRGNVYRYTTTDPDGEISGACGGYTGDYKDMIEEAKGEAEEAKKRRSKNRAGWKEMITLNARIYDNGGATLDRYTILYSDACYGMSDDPQSAQGFNQFCGAASKVVEDGNDALGKRVAFKKLPLAVREAIIDRIKD